MTSSQSTMSEQKAAVAGGGAVNSANRAEPSSSNDQNNNCDRRPGDGSTLTGPATVKPSRREGGDGGQPTRGVGGSIEEDWHLLEVAEEEEEEERSTMTATSKDSSGDQKIAKYIEISPPMESALSPSLIYLCTVLYASIPLASFIAVHLLLLLIFTRFWYITLLYGTYLFLDRKTCNRGGRRIQFVYESKFWSYLAAYFPIKLRYSRNFTLKSSENYILNYHPHGISAFGAVAAFATNGLRFKSIFPHICSRFMVHEALYNVPVMREIFGARGDCSVNSKSFDYMLSKRGTGNLLTLVSGGLAEADLSDPEVMKIVVAKRKGFARKALMHGANLIPCIAFGENSVFTKVNFSHSSFMYKLETKWYQLFKFKHPIYYGNSVFFADSGKGAVPYKRPITVVMGDPIEVERVEEPSQEQVDELHRKYLERLNEIYEANSDLCTEYDTKLQLV